MGVLRFTIVAIYFWQCCALGLHGLMGGVVLGGVLPCLWGACMGHHLR
jgi:ABC-type lipoprotein release transport system permease subunit